MGKRKNHPDEVDDNQRRQNQQQQEGQQHPCTGLKNSHEEEGLHQEEESPQGEPAESWCSCASWSRTSQHRSLPVARCSPRLSLHFVHPPSSPWIVVARGSGPLS